MTQALEAEVFSQPDRYLRVWFSASTGGPFSQLAPDTRIAAVPYALQAEKVKGYANVVVVAKSGGDYTSVQAAIDSITDAAADNPYLVGVAPGVYEEQVTMKPYVHLQGAGQETTIITSAASSSGDWPPTEFTLVLASDTSLRDLSVGNSGTGDHNVALLATAGMTRTLVADVTAQAQGSGAVNFAIFLGGSGTDVTLQGVTALAENGSDAALSPGAGG
jgi:pectin methylesterase-like acyl-CoA thioesterase